MEYLDIIDIETDSVIGNAPKTEIYKKKLPHRIVHITVHRRSGKIVLQKRSKLVGKYPHMWVTGACGHVSSGESYEEAARKELFEEIGLKSQVKFSKQVLFNSEQGMKKLIQVYKTISDDNLVLEDKVSETKEFTLEEIKELPKETLHPELIFLLEQNCL